MCSFIHEVVHWNCSFLAAFDERRAEKKDEIINSSIFKPSVKRPASPPSATERLVKRVRYDKLVKAGGFGRTGESSSNNDSMAKLKMSIKRNNASETDSIVSSDSSASTASSKDVADLSNTDLAKDSSVKNISLTESSLNDSALGSLLSNYDSSDSADSS